MATRSRKPPARSKPLEVVPPPAEDKTPATPPQPQRLGTALAPLAIFVFALALRLWGIGWALPNATRLFSYHPDESLVVTFSLPLNPFLALLDPGFYNYGSLALLTNAAFIHLGEAVGLVTAGTVPGIPSASALLTARLVTAFLGAGTCGFLFGAGRLLYGRRAGIVAALGYAVAPLAVQHGHFATVDVPAVFWLAGALFFAARHLSDEARPRDLLWAGVWSGLAAATKYNAGLVLLSALVAWWVTRDHACNHERRSPSAAGYGGLAGLLGGAAIGFFVGCPGVLLNPSALRAGIAFETQHVREGHGSVFTNTLPAWLYHLVHNLPWALGWPLLLVALAGVVLALVRRRPADGLLLAFLVPYYLLIGIVQVKFARYTLPLFPPLLLLAGALLTDAPRTLAARRLALAAGAVTGLTALLLSLAFDNVMTRPDPRDEAAAFVRGHPIASVGFATGPWFFSPPLAPGLADFRPPLAKKAARGATDPRLVPADGEWNRAQLVTTAPDAVALSEFEYGEPGRAADPQTAAYLGELRRRYPNRRVFAQPVQVFGLRFTNVRAGDLQAGGPLPTQKLPHDMLYTNPTTILWYKNRPTEEPD